MVEKPVNHLKNCDFYHLYVNSIYTEPKCLAHWERELKMYSFDWKRIFCIARVDREPKIQSFQYKIIHRFFPCNKYLSKWNRDIASTCIFCEHEDNLIHYFYECEQTKRFWTDLATFINETIDSPDIAFTCENDLLGRTTVDSLSDFMNLATLRGKWYISQKKMHGSEPKAVEFIPKLKLRLQLERTIYMQRQRLPLFEKTFKNILRWLVN